MTTPPNSRNRSIPRRSLLRVAGATVALPFLGAMRPAFGRMGDAGTLAAVRRMVVIHVPLGWMPQFFFPAKPAEPGSGDESVSSNPAAGRAPSSPYLDLLAAHRGRFTVFSGVSHPGVAGGHGAGQCFLTGARFGGEPTFRNTESLDQFVAQRIGLKDRFASLTLAAQHNGQPPPAGVSLSISRAGVFIPPEVSPARLYRRLFVSGSAEEQAATMRRIDAGGSVLDLIGHESGLLSRLLGPADRDRVDEYFTSVRELEVRLARSREWERKPKPTVEYAQPQDIADANRIFDRTRLMFDLVRLALQTESTRVVTFSLSTSFLVPAVPGVKTETHALTHHGNEPEKIAELKRVEEAQTRCIADLLTALADVPEEGGTLLDHTQVLCGSSLGNASAHSNTNLPVLLAGGGYRHPGHLAFDERRNEPLANLYLTMLQRLGLDVDSFASSTGTIRGLDN